MLNCPHVNATKPNRRLVKSGSFNGSVPPGNKPLPGPMWTQIFNCRHIASPGHNEFLFQGRFYLRVSNLQTNCRDLKTVRGYQASSSNNSSLNYNDVIMGTMASQITSRTIIYSIVYSGADQSKHQSSASLAFVRGIHRSPVNSPHKGQ